MTRFYLEIEGHPLTGEPIHSYTQCPDDVELPEHAECWVPRLPEPFELWDPEAQAFILDEAARAKHEMGETLVSEMRGRKLAQAEMVIAGMDLPDGSLLQREAELRGLSIKKMAALIVSKADMASKEEAELARQAASIKG